MSLPREYWPRILLSELLRAPRFVLACFAVVVMLFTLAGLIWRPNYASSAIILVDEKNIIQPLMEGTAVATPAVDRARLAREVIQGRRFMQRLLQETGLLREGATAEEFEKLMKEVVQRIAIANVGRNLIRLEYRDEDPERTYLVAKRMTDLFIAESLEAKAAESRAAFEFIEKQVQEYHQKLVQAEERLKEFRSANLDARPGSEADISARLNELQARIERTTQELKEAEIKKQSLERQLSGEAEVVSVLSRESQYRARIAELQQRLETLRLSYHDSYPDIVQIRHQINDLEEAIRAERDKREAAKASGRVTIDESVINNPMYQQLRRELSATEVQIDTLKARLAEARRQLEAEVERGRRVHTGEATLAELTRDYQVNRDIYQDLLRRRENARVSMNLDLERQGLSFRLQEPPVQPLEPRGLRFAYFVAFGLILGLALPVGAMALKLHFDSSLRTSSALSRQLPQVFLTAVPHYWTRSGLQAMRLELARAAAGAGLVLFAVLVIGLLRMNGVL
jgi:polysaccharide chain length determinant protein (PEP-CTERM system associated)